MPHRQFEQLRDETYEVVIDSSLEDGYLTYGEYLHKGETEDEFLLSAHVCHPSLANDNCSGVALLTHLAKRMAGLRTRYSYRFLFAPGTIGAITWLARNEDNSQRIKHGLVISMVGDGGGPTYKKSRRGNAKIDRAMIHALRHSGLTPTILDFFPVRLRRAPILFARLQPAGGAFPTQQVRRNSPISHLGGQSRFHRAESSGPVLPPDRRDTRCDRKRRDLQQYNAKMRTTAWEARTLWRGRGRQGRCSRRIWPCYGFSISPTERIRCSILLSAPICLLRPFVTQLSYYARGVSWQATRQTSSNPRDIAHSHPSAKGKADARWRLTGMVRRQTQLRRQGMSSIIQWRPPPIARFRASGLSCTTRRCVAARFPAA